MEEHKLLTAFGHPEHMMHLPPSPHHSPADIRDNGSQLCKQESCTTTAAADGKTLTDSHDLSNTLIQCHGLYTHDAKLDLSLGYGDDHSSNYLHAYKEYFLARASSEPSASSVTEPEDQSSNGGVAATNLPLNASSCASKSGEEMESEFMACSSPPNQGFTSSFAASRGTLTADGSLTSSLYDDKVFFCKFCDRQFHSSQALGGHQNAHKRERLVARSTPRLELPPFSCSALRPIVFPMSNQPQEAALHMLPSCINGDRSKSLPLVAIGERTQSPIVVPSLCNDIFEGPHLLSAMYKTSFGRNCMGSNNVYIIGNRSLGIKAHSLVHKPASVHQALQITPQIGLMRGLPRWPRVDFVNQPHGSMQTTRFATSSLSDVSRFVCHTQAPPCSLLHLRRQCPTSTPSVHDSSCRVTHSDISLLPCSELDSCTASSPGHVDLALHL